MRWFNMLEIKQLNVSFGKKTLFKNASFYAECGHLTVIKGRSGSGKSTFLKAFQFAYDCIYLYEGERIDTLDEENKQKFIYNHLANVHQIPLFIEGMTIGSHINLPFLSACGSKAHIVMNNSCLCRHLILYFN